MGTGTSFSVNEIMDMDIIDCHWYIERLNEQIEDDNKRMKS